ncbi:MAG TPA: DedA family protein [Thermoanaerobacterales bacterium]|nr:DedA family protein [Thermoanaerobacterales bacterium]
MFDISSYAYELLINHGYFGLYFISLIEGTGLPFPIQLALMTVAYFINIDKMSFFYVIIIVTFGNLTGNLVAYFIGSLGGKPVFDKLNRYLHIKEDDINSIREWFDKYGSLTNMISRWIGVTRTPAIWAASLFRINIISYTIYSLIGDLTWAFCWIYIYLKAYSYLEFIIKIPLKYKITAIILIICVIILSWYVVLKIVKNKRIN